MDKLAGSVGQFDQSNMTPDALAALNENAPSRREFFKAAAKAAGALVVGFSAAGSLTHASAQTTTPPTPIDPLQPTGLVDASKVDSWVSIGADEIVTVYSGKCEFGQGIRTVQIQLAAEELSVPLSNVRLIFCQTGFTPDQGTTSGSQSHIAEFGPGGLRQALDTALAAILQLASLWFDVPVSALTVSNGIVSVKGGDSTQQISYGQLLNGQRFNLSLSNSVTPKDPHTYTILGTSVPRIDIPAKAVGSFTYVHNVRVAGMLHGRVVRPPTVGATVVSVDKSSVAALPGNVQVVVKANFVGVVADTQWHAIQAAGALNVNWSTGAALPDPNSLYTYLQTGPTADALTLDSGDTAATMAAAAQTFSAQYLHPYQMHGSIATSCAVADVRGGAGPQATAKIWSATQGVYPQRDSVALVLGIPNSNVEVIYVEGSGCYGLNGNDSVSYDAAIMSQAVGKPVRVQWSRRDEHANGESFGQPYVINLQAGVDKTGQMQSWVYESYTATRGNRPNATTPGNIISGALAGFPTPPVVVPTAATPPSTFGNNGNAASAYLNGVVKNNPAGGTGNIASARVITHTVPSPLFTGPLRSPSRMQNTFANESFIDEVAAGLGQDPVLYRLRHLSDPRLIAVVQAAAQLGNWDYRSSPRSKIGAFGFGNTTIASGRGFACLLYEGNNGYSATVCNVQVNVVTGQVTVTSFYTAVESGPVSNPDGMKNQTEGGLLQGMSRALYEQVKWNATAGIITSTDWNTYPVYQWGQPVPVMKTTVINNPNVSQTGAGECAITLAEAAVANAIFDATGVRIRQVPFTASNVLAAIKAGGKSSNLADR